MGTSSRQGGGTWMNDLREVDLERGMPRAEQAIRQMLFELRRSPGLG